MLYRYWLRSMPLLVNSRLATWLFALAEKFSRSLTHQAPDAPNPVMVWAGAVITAVVAALAGAAVTTVVAVAARDAVTADAATRTTAAAGGRNLWRRVRNLTVTPHLIRA
jgi:hypothetical protein